MSFFRWRNDDKGSLWIGTENGGISILDHDLKTFRTYTHDDIDNTSLANNSRSIRYTATRRAICGSGPMTGASTYIFRRSANTFAHYKHSTSAESLSNNIVLDLLEDKNHLWVGTDGGGLDEIDQRTGKFTHFFSGCAERKGNWRE